MQIEEIHRHPKFQRPLRPVTQPHFLKIDPLPSRAGAEPARFVRVGAERQWFFQPTERRSPYEWRKEGQTLSKKNGVYGAIEGKPDIVSKSSNGVVLRLSFSHFSLKLSQGRTNRISRFANLHDLGKSV